MNRIKTVHHYPAYQLPGFILNILSILLNRF